MFNFRSRGGYTPPPAFSYDDYLNNNYWGKAKSEIKDQYIKDCANYLVANNSTINYRFGNYTLQTKENRDFIKEASLYFVHKLYEEKEYMKPEYVDPETITDGKEKEAILRKKALYESLEDKVIPGTTPLDQAIYLFFSMVDKDSTGKAKSNVNSLSQEEMQDLVNKISEDDEMLHDKEVQELIATKNYKSLKGRDLKALNKLSMIKEFGGEFKVHLEIEEEYCFNGPIPAKKMLNNYSDIINIDLYQFFMPDFNARLATKNLVINARTKKTDHKQKIILLIDYSGEYIW